MPSYYPPGTRRGNRFYIVRGRINGKEREVRTRARDKGSAEESWHDFKRGVRKRRLPGSRETATFDDAVRLYEAARNLSRGEQRHVDRLRQHFGTKSLSTLRPADLVDAAHTLYPTVTPQTKNRQAIEPCAAILHYAARNGLCDWIRAEKLPTEEPERRLVRPAGLSPVIAATEGPLNVILVTLAYQGWRITETLMVRRDKFDAANCRVQRWVSKSRTWKWTPLDPEVCRLWQTLPHRPDGFLFPYRDRHNFYRSLRPLLKRLRRHWTPHMSRRGFAAALIEQGADLKSVMAAGGWQDIRSVVIYADANVEQARRTIGLLRARERAKHRKRLA